MTDNEIIKALECCRNGLCMDCPRINTPAHILLCKEQLMCETLDLINRQKAEIERLKQENFDMSLTVETWKVEAVKEFAEELIKRCSTEIDGYYGEIVWTDDIDNLVKEMVGDAE